MMDISMTPAIPAPAESHEARLYRRRIFAWAMYDWGDHGFLTTTIVTFFPPYFIAIAATAFDKETAANVFSLVLSLTLFLSAIVAPIIGTYADITGRRKRVLIAITGLGSLFASLMVVLTSGMWVLGLILYAGTQIALNVALGMNSSLLPHVSRSDDLNRASSLGYALGYVGGGLLLAANTALFLFKDKLGLASDTAVQIAFFTTGIWWAVFT